ncbi:MAG: glycosyltransferase [Hydrogenophaga sp.]|nr:glycosyltransferase [Hydrogenophaga sp.]
MSATGGVALLDSRLDISMVPESVAIRTVSPTILGRLLAEWRLMKLAGSADTVLCFGNLPPLLRNNGAVTVFLQNRYIFGNRDLRAFSVGKRLRIRLERAWFAMRVDARRMSIYVQTPSMAEEMLRETGIKACVFPFAPSTAKTVSISEAPRFDFIYVASGEPHKNHAQLIEAWKLLGRQGLFPSLCLTLDPVVHPELVHALERATQDHGLQITNLGVVSLAEIEHCYQRSRALIYPSTLESFGLPLIEAAALGLPILASELDYVRDVVSPAASFDPNSALSIARAVKRFLRQGDEPQKIFSSADFLREIQGSERTDHARSTTPT